MIEFNDVAVCYDPQSRYPVNALEGVTLKIAAGEWVFFVGPSGAGKSTLLKLVYGGVGATHGMVVVDGQNVTQLLPREIPLLRRKIGVVFQDFQLLPQKTVWENVAFALQVIGAPQKRLVRDVPHALETVGLTYKSGALPHELSGGEQQRVAIARAIVNSPRILLADEPTGNLDPQTAWEIAQVLDRISERGTTILMATHDRAIVDAMHRRVVRFADGKVISDEAEGIYHPEDDDPRTRQRPQDRAPEAAPAVASTTRTAPQNGHYTPRQPADPTPERPWRGTAVPAMEETLPVVTAGATPLVTPAPAPPPPAASAITSSATAVSDHTAIPEHTAAPDHTAMPEHDDSEPDRAAPDEARLVEPYLEHATQSRAPIGSPDNPIVQFGPNGAWPKQ